MSKNKTAKEKRPWHILIWLILYLVNLLAALAFQYFFIHTYSAPLTAESLGSISGKNEVTIENQEAIGQLTWSGLFRQQGYIQGIHMLTALGLLLLESWIYLRIQKK